jgi:hypothetical protein
MRKPRERVDTVQERSDVTSLPNFESALKAVREAVLIQG